MTESTSQGIPFLDLGVKGLRLYKCNDISFTNLARQGFRCNDSPKKPDQLVTFGEKVLIGIEDKSLSTQMDEAIRQIKDNYITALPETHYFIARAGERVKVFYRLKSSQLTEIGTTLRGREVTCFGVKVITGENKEVRKYLRLFSQQILKNQMPSNGSIEIDPPSTYYNPLIVKQNTIFNLWQKIFVSTGENAHICLSTFVELLLYKGMSDASLLPQEYSIDALTDENKKNSLHTYKKVVRSYIRTNIFPTIANQPGIINGFAFEEQETVFKAVLQDLSDLGNLSQRQLDPDFKRRVIEAFLGSAHKEGTIKNGKHLTPRIIIQAVWEMANPKEGKRIVDPACGVGGFILEGLNYPYQFDVMKYNCFGVDRAEEMIITAKANMMLHILDKFADPKSNKQKLVQKINETFYQAKNNGTGTLGELEKTPSKNSEFRSKYPADYIFANVPFYVNGVAQIDSSLKDIGLSSFYDSCGIGVESRFLKYILSEIERGDPGVAFVIVTDGILYRHKDNIRDTINENADVIGIVSLPKGCFQNNNWKTSILIFKKKAKEEHAPVFLYNAENIGVSLDSYRTPIQENDIPGLKRAWCSRASGETTDPKCRMIPRKEFLATLRWSDLFLWCNIINTDDNISFSEFIEAAEKINVQIGKILKDADSGLGAVFTMEQSIDIELGDENYFDTTQPEFKATVKHARLNVGRYPLYSSQVTGPVALMEDAEHRPILADNESGETKKIISWNIKGDPCEDIRAHDIPFYATENRGLITVKSNKIHFDYLLYYLREHLKKLGNFKRSDEAHVGKVKRLTVKLPVDNKGNIDLNKQAEIASNYQKILQLRKDVDDKMQELKVLMKNIDIFK